MHLAIFIPQLEGGGEKVMLDLAEAFVRAGHRVDFLVSTADSNFATEIECPIKIIVLNARNPIARTIRLVRYLRSGRPAALFTFYDFANVASLAKRLARVETKVVHGVHNTISQLFRSRSGVKAHLRRLGFPYLVRMADCIVAVSHGVARDLAKQARLPIESVQVIYNPMPLQAIRKKALAPAAHPFFKESASPVVLGLGHLVERKDFATLVRAFQIVRRAMPARLVIVGEGSERGRLEALVTELQLEEDVSLPGALPNPYPLLARSAVFVLSSRFEGLGMVLVEALGLGIPVVSTNCPSGPEEILEQGRYGRLVPVGDYLKMAEAILDSLRTYPSASNVAEQVLDRFDTERVANQYLQLV